MGRHSLNDRLQNNALRRIGDRFGNIVDINAVLLEMIFIKRNLLLVAPDAVGFPDDQRIKAVLCGIREHALEPLPYFEKAFVEIEIVTPRGSNNARVWDTSNRGDPGRPQ